MRKIIVGAILFLGAMTCQAQEKVMNIQKKDGTTMQTRVADLKQISFLTLEEGGKGLKVTTLGGESAMVLFEVNPVVTVSNGNLLIKSNTAETLQFVISDLAEIEFCDASEETKVREVNGFACVLQDGCVILRNLPEGEKAFVYTMDGRSIPTPPCQNGELRLSRATMGKGIFIVKVGTFSGKIQL